MGRSKNTSDIIVMFRNCIRKEVLRSYIITRHSKLAATQAQINSFFQKVICVAFLLVAAQKFQGYQNCNQVIVTNKVLIIYAKRSRYICCLSHIMKI